MRCVRDAGGGEGRGEKRPKCDNSSNKAKAGDGAGADLETQTRPCCLQGGEKEEEGRRSRPTFSPTKIGSKIMANSERERKRERKMRKIVTDANNKREETRGKQRGGGAGQEREK